MGTVQNIVKRFKSMGIAIPHPLPETIHTAEEVDICLPCKYCPLDYECQFCDGFFHIICISDPAELTEYLASGYATLREFAYTKFEELQR